MGGNIGGTRGGKQKGREGGRVKGRLGGKVDGRGVGNKPNFLVQTPGGDSICWRS